jgi:DNA-binding transcriptional LysR family regulator
MATNYFDRVELMRTYVRIVEAGSLTAAAMQLHTTQPTISRRLKALEQYLGGTLVHRTTHQLKLTELGERYYTGSRQVLAGWDAFESEVSGAVQAPEGKLRIIAPHAFGQEILVKPLGEFMQRYPKLNIEWLLHDDRSITDFVANDIDCAIQVGEVRNDNLVAIRIAEVPRIVVATPELIDHTKQHDDPRALQNYPWLALQTYYRHQVTLHHIKEPKHCDLTFTPRFFTDSLYALRSAVLNGLGIAVGSMWMLSQDINERRLVNLLPEWRANSLPVYVVYPYAQFYPAKLTTFVRFMRQRMRDQLDEIIRK